MKFESIKFKPLTDYEKMCLKICSSIKFTAKHGILANNLYLEYKGELICLNSEYSREKLTDQFTVPRDLLYGFAIIGNFSEFVDYNKQVHDQIIDRDIIINYDFLNYEDRMKIQNIIEEYEFNVNTM